MASVTRPTAEPFAVGAGDEPHCRACDSGIEAGNLGAVPRERVRVMALVPRDAGST